MSKSVGTQTFAIGLIGAAGYAGQIFEALALQHENLELTSYRGHRPDALSDEDQARLCASDAVVLAIPGEAFIILWFDALSPLYQYQPRTAFPRLLLA